MKKEAYYFPHDSNAKDDPKCVSLIEQLGLEGYGIFWVLVEILRDQPGFKYPLSLIPAIARRYNTTSEKVKATIANYGLFDVANEEFFYSKSLVNRMLPLQEKKEQAKLAGMISAQKRRERMLLMENQLNDSSTDVEQTLNISSTIREEKRREEKIREEKKKEEKKEKAHNFSSEIKDFTASLSHFFSDHIIQRLDKTEKWNWVDAVDKLIRLDGYTHDEITTAVKHATGDNFWSKNFLSLTKLRKKNDDGVKYIKVFLQLSQKPKAVDNTDEVMRIYNEKYAEK